MGKQSVLSSEVERKHNPFGDLQPKKKLNVKKQNTKSLRVQQGNYYMYHLTPFKKLFMV